MSIIIKGLDMPKNCGECKFFDRSWTDKNDVWCNLTENYITFVGEVADFCPLIEIPKGHGRLRDETILADIMDKELDSIAMERESISKSARLSLIRDLALEFHNAPTILEAEE